MLIACWFDMLFRPKSTVIFWFLDKQKTQITFKTRKERKEYFKIHDHEISAYQIIPTNKFLRKFWDKF